MFNWLNSVSWVELDKDHVQGSRKLPGVISVYELAEDQ